MEGQEHDMESPHPDGDRNTSRMPPEPQPEHRAPAPADDDDLEKTQGIVRPINLAALAGLNTPFVTPGRGQPQTAETSPIGASKTDVHVITAQIQDLATTTGVMGVPNPGPTLPFSKIARKPATKAEALKSMDVDTTAEAAEPQKPQKMSSAACYQYAAQFSQYPDTTPDQSLEVAKILLEVLRREAGIRWAAIPTEIRTAYENLDTIHKSLPGIPGDRQKVFGSTEFTAAWGVIGALKLFGYETFMKFGKEAAKQEKKEYLKSPEGEAAKKRYPELAQPYEKAPNKIETAKKNYEERLKQAVRWLLSQANEENLLLLQEQFPLEKIADFITMKTSALIRNAVDKIKSQLSEDKEAQLYDNLPVTITSLPDKTYSEGNVQAVFGTDKPIPDAFGTDFQNAVTRALFGAKTLELAAHSNLEQNVDALQYYACAINGNILPPNNNKSGRINFGTEAFYGLIPQDFFADYMVLAHRNGNITALRKRLQDDLKTNVSKGKTMMAVDGAANFQSIFMNNLDFLRPQQKSEPEAQKTAPVYISGDEATINLMNDLQATTLCLLAQKDAELARMRTELETAGTKITGHLAEKLKISNKANEENRDANERANAAEQALKVQKDQFVAFLNELKGQGGLFGKRKSDEKIEEKIKKLTD